MTILLTIIIASILCGVLFSMMWASSNSLCQHPQNVGIKIFLEPKDGAEELEPAVACIMRQFERLNAEPDIYVSTERLNDAGLKEASFIAELYELKLVPRAEI